MTLQEHIAYIHRAATTLPVDPQDLVELRAQLGELIEQAKAASSLCYETLVQQRQADRPSSRWDNPDYDIPRRRPGRQHR